VIPINPRQQAPIQLLVRAIALARYGFQALAIDDVYAGVTVANGLWRLQAPSREGNAGTVGAEHGRKKWARDVWFPKAPHRSCC